MGWMCRVCRVVVVVLVVHIAAQDDNPFVEQLYCKQPATDTVLVLGAGIAGLTAASPSLLLHS